MKVGIMSMQRIVNYGSFLQAYGLKKICENLGAQVEFVDYWVKKPIITDDQYYRNTWRNIDVLYEFYRNYVYEYIRGKKAGTILDKKYSKYLMELGISARKRFHSKVDLLIVGSDEVFNCTQENPEVDYSPELFGANRHSQKLISYAASFGSVTIEALQRYGISKEIAGYLDDFDEISVRDKNSIDIVDTLIKKKAKYHLDPVLIYPFAKEMAPKPNIDNYILVYGYINRFSDKEEISAIKKFAEEHGKLLVSVGYHQEWIEKKIEANPFELLSYFCYADYIITDTFHGAVLSIKYSKQFAVWIRDSNKQKLGDLLDRLNMNSQRVYSPQCLQEVLEHKIDYDQCQTIIEKERRNSLDYLSRWIKS